MRVLSQFSLRTSTRSRCISIFVDPADSFRISSSRMIRI